MLLIFLTILFAALSTFYGFYHASAGYLPMLYTMLFDKYFPYTDCINYKYVENKFVHAG